MKRALTIVFLIALIVLGAFVAYEQSPWLRSQIDSLRGVELVDVDTTEEVVAAEESEVNFDLPGLLDSVQDLLAGGSDEATEEDAETEEPTETEGPTEEAVETEETSSGFILGSPNFSARDHRESQLAEAQDTPTVEVPEGFTIGTPRSVDDE